MIEDLTLGQDDDGREPIGPALIPAAPYGPNELLVAERMHRTDETPGACAVIFTTVNEDGEEVWEPPLPGQIGEGERWWRIMDGWPRVPTIEEVQQFQVYARAKRLADWWGRLAAARAEDDAEQQQQQPAPAAAVGRASRSEGDRDIPAELTEPPDTAPASPVVASRRQPIR